MTKIYSAKSLKKWDDFTIKNTPIASIDLMEKAAIACSKQILGSFLFESVSIFCGLGNNGGDGMAIARILHARGIKVDVYVLGSLSEACDNLQENKKRLPKGIELIELSDKSTINIQTELIIDAIFGSGLSRPIEGWIGTIIDQLNNQKTPIIAIDLPSGLFSDDNRPNNLKHCIKADLTLTIQVPKMSFFHAEYEKYVGRFQSVDIDLLSNFNDDSVGILVDKRIAKLNEISNFSHKGNKGYLSIIGGFDTMAGAIVLASKAAFRTGCGYVGAISNEKSFTPLMIQLPEAIWQGDSLEFLAKKTNAIAIGPGLGNSENASNTLTRVLKLNLPMVIDADAINLIAANEDLKNRIPKQAILTPHLKELERLIGPNNSPEERLEKQLDFSLKNEVFIIQKGAFSKLTTPSGELYINSTGNKGMASAGMGDALTGMIGSFLAQGYSPQEAAINGMFYHGRAGDIGVKTKGERGFITSDLIDSIPAALRSF